MNALHASQLEGHSGIQASYARAKTMFYWPGIKRDIKWAILECDVCRRCKRENVPYPGLLQPLPEPNYSWSHITMDFIEGLPKSEEREVILVVIDRFTKYAHFVGLSHPFTAITVARVFMDHIHKLHGLPQEIVSDRYKIFISQFWKEMMRILGIQLNLSTAYQPQTDGQSEKLNQTLEMYLRCMVFQRPGQ